MDRKVFDSPDESMKEKLRKCKDEAEIRRLIADDGPGELSDEMMEDVSGGGVPNPTTMIKDEDSL